MSGAWRQLSGHLTALAGFVAATCLFTFPGVTRLNTHLIGAGDNFGFVWELWWFHEALFVRHTNPLSNNTLFFPTPQVELICSTPVNVLPGVLLVAWWGPIVAYNVLVLVGLVLAGLGAYLLGWQLTRRRPAAFLAGLLYAFSSVHMSHVANGHLNVLTIQWVPFAALALLRLYDKPSWRRAGWLGVAVALVALSDIYVATYALGTLFVTFAAYHLLSDRVRLLRRAFLVRAGAALGAAGLAVAPYYASIVTTLSGATATAELRASVSRFGQDLVQLVLPAPWNPWFGSLCAFWQGRLTNTDNWGYLGWVPLGLAVFALWSARKGGHGRLGFWACFGLVALVLSLGTQLHVAGPTPWAMPYGLATEMPLLQNLRAPGRFAAFTALALAMGAAFGAAELLRRKPRIGPFALGGLTLLALAEATTFAPFPSTAAAVPAYYQRLASEPDGGLLELPVGDPSWGGPTQHWMYFQSVHGRPLVYGHAPRPTDAALAFSRTTPVVRELVELIHTDWVLEVPASARAHARERLAAAGISHVLLHREAIIPAERFTKLVAELDALFGPAAHQDDQLIVYRLKPGLHRGLTGRAAKR